MSSRSGRFVLAGAFVLALSGCGGATLRREPAPLPEAPPVAQVSIGDVEVRVEAVIVRNAPGSWALDAFWDEYRIALANRAPGPVVVREVVLVDWSGRRVETRGSRTELLQYTRELSAPPPRPHSTADEVASSVAHAATYIGAPAAVGALMAPATVAIPLSAAAPPVGVIVAGAALASAGIYVVSEAVAKGVTDMQEAGVDAELARRRTVLPASVEAGQERRLALFFPVTVLPAEMRVSLATQAGERVATLDLREKLARAHAEPPATVVRREEPDFPRAARDAGIRSGYVVALAQLADDGHVTSVTIQEAEPKGYFEREAARALYRWQFTPRITAKPKKAIPPSVFPAFIPDADFRRYESVRFDFRE